jgi:hypothetical protein
LQAPATNSLTLSLSKGPGKRAAASRSRFFDRLRVREGKTGHREAKPQRSTGFGVANLKEAYHVALTSLLRAGDLRQTQFAELAITEKSVP